MLGVTGPPRLVPSGIMPGSMAATPSLQARPYTVTGPSIIVPVARDVPPQVAAIQHQQQIALHHAANPYSTVYPMPNGHDGYLMWPQPAYYSVRLSTIG